MNEMANAAYWLEIEERDAYPVHRHPASGYDVIPVDGGPKAATIMSSVFRFVANEGDSIRPYDGLIRHQREWSKETYRQRSEQHRQLFESTQPSCFRG